MNKKVLSSAKNVIETTLPNKKFSIWAPRIDKASLPGYSKEEAPLYQPMDIDSTCDDVPMQLDNFPTLNEIIEAEKSGKPLMLNMEFIEENSSTDCSISNKKGSEQEHDSEVYECEEVLNEKNQIVEMLVTFPKPREPNKALINTQLKAIELFDPSKTTEVKVDFYCSLMKDFCDKNKVKYDECEMLHNFAMNNYNTKRTWEYYVVKIGAFEYYKEMTGRNCILRLRKKPKKYVQAPEYKRSL